MKRLNHPNVVKLFEVRCCRSSFQKVFQRFLKTGFSTAALSCTATMFGSPLAGFDPGSGLVLHKWQHAHSVRSEQETNVLLRHGRRAHAHAHAWQLHPQQHRAVLSTAHWITVLPHTTCLCLLCQTQVIHDPDQKLLIMVMEFMPGGSILSSSRLPGLTTEPLPEPAARNYFR
jgi:serine/threonine protein kinase